MKCKGEVKGDVVTIGLGGGGMSIAAGFKD
jgi:hypothetical protein